MALAQVLSRAGVGVTAPLVTVEVHCGGGLPRMSIVGNIGPDLAAYVLAIGLIPALVFAWALDSGFPQHPETRHQHDLRLGV